MRDLIRRSPPWAWVLLFGAALILPQLGTFGLWDPSEIQQADVARELAQRGAFGDVTVDGRYSPRPPLYVWLVALGFKTLGVNEMAGRLPLALCGLLALLLAYRFGRRVLSARAGVAAAFVLLTTPSFLFQCRHLASDVVYYACLLAAIGGLIAFVWPADGRRSRVDLVIGALGLVLGFLSHGLLLGTVFPLVCVALALAMSWRAEHRDSPDGLWQAEAGDLALGQTVGQALRGASRPLALALTTAAAAIGGLIGLLDHSGFLLLGATVRRVAAPPTFEVGLKEIGFATYPWFALAPLALLSFLWTLRAREATPGSVAAADQGPYRTPQEDHQLAPAAAGWTRDAPIKLLLVITPVLGYFVAMFWAGFLEKVRYPALPILALAIGLLLHEIFGAPRHRYWGLIAAAVILALQQDFFVAPESLAFSHLLQTAKYPAELNIKLEMRLFGAALALLWFLALIRPPGTRQHPLDRVMITGGRIRRGWVFVLNLGVSLLNGLTWVADQIGGGIRRIGGENNWRYYWGALACCGIFAAWCSWYLMPELSLHTSNKALFETYHQCKQPGQRLSQYLVSGRGAAYYNDGQVDQVRSQQDLFKLLQKPERAFVLVAAGQLASLDKAARRAKIDYHVLDDRNSQYLILSNKLAGDCAEDLNPLRRFVVSKRPTPKKPLRANFENRVELIGYDLDDTVYRGGKFPITLYFHVKGQMPAGYKVFIHFDQPASRFHGDHVPLNGKYPTQYWLPGDYVIDRHEVEIPLLTTPSGRYKVYAGFWLGSKRLKVVEGPNDGGDRVILGNLRVR